VFIVCHDICLTDLMRCDLFALVWCFYICVFFCVCMCCFSAFITYCFYLLICFKVCIYVCYVLINIHCLLNRRQLYSGITCLSYFAHSASLLHVYGIHCLPIFVKPSEFSLSDVTSKRTAFSQPFPPRIATLPPTRPDSS